MQSEVLISAVVTFGVGFMATLSLLAAARKVALQRARAGAQPRRRSANAHR